MSAGRSGERVPAERAEVGGAGGGPPAEQRLDTAGAACSDAPPRVPASVATVTAVVGAFPPPSPRWPWPAGVHNHRRARFIAGLRVNEMLSWSRDVDSKQRREFVRWLLDGRIPQWLEVRCLGGRPAGAVRSWPAPAIESRPRRLTVPRLQARHPPLPLPLPSLPLAPTRRSFRTGSAPACCRRWSPRCGRGSTTLCAGELPPAGQTLHDAQGLGAAPGRMPERCAWRLAPPLPPLHGRLAGRSRRRGRTRCRARACCSCAASASAPSRSRCWASRRRRASAGRTRTGWTACVSHTQGGLRGRTRSAGSWLDSGMQPTEGGGVRPGGCADSRQARRSLPPRSAAAGHPLGGAARRGADAGRHAHPHDARPAQRPPVHRADRAAGRGESRARVRCMGRGQGWPLASSRRLQACVQATVQ